MPLPISMATALRGFTLACLLHSTASADVWVVDAAGGGDFLDLPQAISAASDGDILLLRSGSYSSFTLAGKGLSIVADLGASPKVAASIRVEGLPAESTVVLSGLEVIAPYTTDLGKVDALVLQVNAGAVRVQDCTLVGADNADIDAGQTIFRDGKGGRGASLDTCQNVVFTRTTFVGGRGVKYNGSGTGGSGGEGLYSLSSIVALYECHSTGGLGGLYGSGGDGGPAVFAPDYGFYASGCSFTGGDGGFATDNFAGVGGDGGPGAKVGSFSHAQLLGNSIEGGKAGGSVLSPGQAGVPIEVASGGTVTQFSGTPRRFEFSSLGWESTSALLTVYGEPGDRVWFPTSSQPGFRFVPGLSGVWVIGLPSKMLSVPQGIVPASGKLELAVPLVDLAGLGSLRHHQGYVVSSGGQGFIGTPVASVRLTCTLSGDCDGSGVPDACEIQSGAVSDCNHNGIPDSCDLAVGTLLDCNLNGVADVCDIAGGTSVDCGQDGVPDECQFDCNGNGIDDLCDVQSGASADCDGNLVPDECDVDCNANGVPDACDIANGTSVDVNSNGVPDECQTSVKVYFVDDDGPPYGADGSSAKPFPTLGEAMAYAVSGDTLLVRDGTYSGPENRGLSFGGRDLVIASQNGPAGVVIDCEGLDRAFTFDAGTTLAARLEGLTILDGNAFDAQPEPARGGGVLVQQGGAATLVGCVIRQCEANRGGGVHVNSSSDAVLLACTLQENTASGPLSGFGGGLSSLAGFGEVMSGSVSLKDCTVSNNRGALGSGLALASPEARVDSCLVQGNEFLGSVGEAASAIYHAGGGVFEAVKCRITDNEGRREGGAIFTRGPQVRISHCVIAGNTITPFGGSRGGGICLSGFGDNINAVVESCLIANNTSVDGGGLYAANVNDLDVRDCTIVDNDATFGGGTYFLSSNSISVRNCVVWGNVGSFFGPAMGAHSVAVDVDFCDVQGGLAGTATKNGASFVWGAHNLDADPLFVDPDGPDGNVDTWLDNDYRFGPLSPCADAGDDAAVSLDVFDLDGDLDVLEPVPFDLDLLPRFEDDPAVPDTGLGTAPIVDLGAYERP